jgi:hypothetical protein
MRCDRNKLIDHLQVVTPDAAIPYAKLPAPIYLCRARPPLSGGTRGATPKIALRQKSVDLPHTRASSGGWPSIVQLLCFSSVLVGFQSFSFILKHEYLVIF